jgi:hypothetical protein
MATKGRGGDSMLVHMTPGEVQALQTLAERHGGTLTINPETGQPEANFLKKLLPTIVGAGLNFFAPGLGSAVGGMFGLGAAAGTGIAVGGISALATGSLSRGLMAGLGAYGGASLAGGLEGLGSTAVAPEALAAANASADPIMSLTAAKDAATAAGIAPATGAEAAKQGLAMAANNPKSFMTAMGGPTKALGAAYAAASPMMAADTVQTTTPRADTGYIRQKKFNPYTQQYIDLEPVKASEWGSRRFSDFAGGGIVALAAGGTSYQDLTKDSTPEQIASAYKAFTSGAGGDTQANQAAALQYLGNLGIGQGTIGQAYEKFQAAPTYTQFSNEQIGGYLAANPNADIAAATAQFNADPRAVNQFISQMGAGFLDPTQTARGSGSAHYYDAFSKYGIDANELFAANQMLNPGYSFAGDKTATGLARAFETAQGFKGFNPQEGNRLANDIEWVKKMDAEGANAVDIARLTGLSIGEVQAREAAAREAMKKIVTRPIVPGNIGGVPYVPGGVSGGGNTVVNPNGTITTTPNIPGRPEGGFTGMGQLKDVYTQGGGSLGQSNLFVPKAIAEMYERYGNTGGSQQAYDYLMGKGSADIKKPVTQSGELMLPYAQSVLGQEIAAASGPATQKYLFDPKTRRYILNPAYVDPNAAKDKEEAVAPLVSEGANGGLMPKRMALGGLGSLAGGGQAGYNLGSYSDGGRLLRGPGDGVSDSIPATIGDKQPARLADGEFVVPARIVSELGNGSTEAGARKLYAMMDRVQKARGKTTGKNRVAANTRADKYLPA